MQSVPHMLFLTSLPPSPSKSQSVSVCICMTTYWYVGVVEGAAIVELSGNASLRSVLLPHDLSALEPVADSVNHASQEVASGLQNNVKISALHRCVQDILQVK